MLVFKHALNCPAAKQTHKIMFLWHAINTKIKQIMVKVYFLCCSLKHLGSQNDRIDIIYTIKHDFKIKMIKLYH